MAPVGKTTSVCGSFVGRPRQLDFNVCQDFVGLPSSPLGLDLYRAKRRQAFLVKFEPHALDGNEHEGVGKCSKADLVQRMLQNDPDRLSIHFDGNALEVAFLGDADSQLNSQIEIAPVCKTLPLCGSVFERECDPDLDACQGLTEWPSSPLGLDLYRAKRRQAFPVLFGSHVVESSECQGVDGCLSSVLAQGMSQAALDCLSVHEDGKTSVVACPGDAELLFVRRARAFRSCAEASALAAQITLNEGLLSTTKACAHHQLLPPDITLPISMASQDTKMGFAKSCSPSRSPRRKITHLSVVIEDELPCTTKSVTPEQGGA